MTDAGAPSPASLRAAIGSEGSTILEDHDALGHGVPRDEVKRIGGGRLPCGEIEVDARFTSDDSREQHARLRVDGAVTVTLDGPYVQPSGWMQDRMPGPTLDVAGTPGTVTWRSHGRRYKPTGRLRTWEIAIGDDRWQLWGGFDQNHLARGTEVKRRTPHVVDLRAGGLAPRESSLDRPPTLPPALYVGWTAQTTHLETLLAVLLIQTMPHEILRNLPEKLIGAVLPGRADV